MWLVMRWLSSAIELDFRQGVISHFRWSKHSLLLFRYHLSEALLELDRLWEAACCCLWLDETIWHVILGCVYRWVQRVLVWQCSWLL